MEIYIFLFLIPSGSIKENKHENKIEKYGNVMIKYIKMLSFHFTMLGLFLLKYKNYGYNFIHNSIHSLNTILFKERYTMSRM